LFDFLFNDEPNPRDSLLDLALGYIEEGDLDAARLPLQQMLDLDPADLDAYNYLALITREEDDMTTALAILEKGKPAAHRVLQEARGANLWIDNRARVALKLLGEIVQVLYLLDRFEEAVEVAQRVLEHNPSDNLGVSQILALIRHRQGDIEAAIGHYRDAEPRADVLFNLGLALLQSDRQEEALVAIRRGIFENIFLAPLILGRSPEPSYESEWRNRSCRVDAGAFEKTSGQLWCGEPEAIAFLERVWTDARVKSDVSEYVRLVEEGSPEDDSTRNGAGERLRRLRSENRLSRTGRSVLARVKANATAEPTPSPRTP